MRQNRHDIFIERGFASLNDILKFRQPKNVIKIARGVKKVPLVIKKKYPKILKNAFKMVHDVNFRKSFAYFKRKIEKIEGKTDPNEHNLREKILFEKKKNMNNSMNFYVHDYWREEWILENWKKHQNHGLKDEEAIMEESKILLNHSSWNVSEIAYSLGFTEVTHFNNFFKKHLQQSPLKFRNV